MEQYVYSITHLSIYKISVTVVTESERDSLDGVILYLHQHRLRQLLSVDYFDGYLLTRNTMDPQLNQS